MVRFRIFVQESSDPVQFGQVIITDCDFHSGGLSFLYMVKVYHETEWDSIAVHVEKNVIHVERLSLWLVQKIPFRCYTLVKRGEVYYFDSRKDELHEAAAGI